jgi:hypothetical protein
VLWESIRNKITRTNNILFGRLEAQGIPKGVFGHVLVRKAKKSENFSWAGGAVLKYRTGQNFFFGAYGSL